MVLIFAKMSELEHLHLTHKGKEKELTTANILQLFNQMTVKQLIGLEALCVIFQNSHVIN
jgi:hypothetical protein